MCFLVATMLYTFTRLDEPEPQEAAPGPDRTVEVVPVGAGVTHTVGSVSDWDRAVRHAGPGDVIRITSTIGARLAYRGDNDGSTGEGADGSPSSPIVITADPGVWIDPGNKSSGFGAVDIIAADHVHVVGVRVRNAQFGIRCMQCRGSAGNPVRIAQNTVTQIGHAGIHFSGHWRDHAPGSHGLIEGNTISHTGKTAARFGEGIYLGYGSVEWIDVTSDVVVRGNEISFTGAEGVDVKPGTRNIEVVDNSIHDLAPIDGGAISAHYVNAIPNPHPGTIDRVVVRGNRIWNVNLTGTAGSNDWAIWVGHGGVDIIENVVWGLRNDSSRTRAVRVRATQAFGPHPIRIENNIFWSARGWLAEGQPSGAANVIASSNRGVDPGSSEIVVDAAAFAGPIPPLGSPGTADSGAGPGSAFALAGSAAAPPPGGPQPSPAPAPAPSGSPGGGLPPSPAPTEPPSAAPTAAAPPTPSVPAPVPPRAPQPARPTQQPARPTTSPATPAVPAPPPVATPAEPGGGSPGPPTPAPRPGPTPAPGPGPTASPGPARPVPSPGSPDTPPATEPSDVAGGSGAADGSLATDTSPAPDGVADDASAWDPSLRSTTGTGDRAGVQALDDPTPSDGPAPVDALRRGLAGRSDEPGASGTQRSDPDGLTAPPRLDGTTGGGNTTFGVFVVAGLLLTAIGLAVRAARIPELARLRLSR